MNDKQDSRGGMARLLEVLGWIVLAAFLIVAVPLFLRMPVTNDVTSYDICARHVLEGGPLERDFLFLAPPGIVWARALVRFVGGWSSEAVRVADLAVVAAVIWLLVRWLRASGVPLVVRIWTALLLSAFYLSTTEWVHCQPDIWMLLPALVALHLRGRQVAALADPDAPRRWIAGRSVLEGICWGSACLVKPYVAIPGILAWSTFACVMRHSSRVRLGRLAWDAIGLLAGGLFMGAIWQIWLLHSGSWTEFWHNHVAHRGEFYSRTQPYLLRSFYMFLGLWPWSLLHLFAIPVAVATVVGSLRSRKPVPSSLALQSILAAFYLGWLLQANFIQSQLDYQFAPVVLLALVLLVGWGLRATLPTGGAGLAALGVFALFVILALAQGKAFQAQRLALWGRCCGEVDSPELKDLLSLYKHQNPGHAPNWVELDQVAQYLRTRKVADRELLCYDPTAIPLYLHLGLHLPTRYIYPSVYVSDFLYHRESIRLELAAESPRFIVTDRLDGNVPRTNPDASLIGMPIHTNVETLPELPNWWPYSEPVVFAAGRYSVHEVAKQPQVRK
jgi:hypothetical protein